MIRKERGKSISVRSWLTACAMAAVGCLCSCSKQPATPATNRPAVSAPAKDEVVFQSAAAWQHFCGLAPGRGLGAIALYAKAPIDVDGDAKDAQWADAFELALPASEDGECRPGNSVRFLWTDETLYVLVKTKIGKPIASYVSVCELTFCEPKSAKRYSFWADEKGSGAGHVMDLEQHDSIDAALWKSSRVKRDVDYTTEFAINCKALGIGRAGEGPTLEVLVRTGRNPDLRPKPDDVPLRWLLDATHGSVVNPLYLDQRKTPWSNAGLGNVAVVEEGVACQWPGLLVVSAPSAELQVPVAAIMGKDGGGRSVHASLVSCGDSRDAGSPRLTLSPRPGAGPGIQDVQIAVPAPKQSGLYELRLTTDRQGQPALLGAMHVWVTADWKKDTRQVLLPKRAQFEAELAKDPFVTSILLAHVNGLMSRADNTPLPDYAFLRAAREFEEAAGAMLRHEIPAIPRGLSTIQVRGRKRELEAFTVLVPTGYDVRMTWPFALGYGIGYIPVPDMVCVHSFPTCADAISEVIAALGSSVKLDKQRVYALGDSQWSHAISDCVFRYPDLWTAAGFIWQARWSPLWANASSMPVKFFNNKFEHYDVITMKGLLPFMKEAGCSVDYREFPDVVHGPLPARYISEIAAWLLSSRGTPVSKHVRLVSDGYEMTRAYWVAVDAIGETTRLASISAEIEQDRIVVETKNVLGYTLDLAKAPAVPGDKPVEIVENGKSVGSVPRDPPATVFKRAPDGPAQELCKRAGASGPIKDIFGKPCVIVTGQGGTPELAGRAKDVCAAMQQTGLFPAARLLTEDKATAQEVGDCHLVLVGQVGQNEWLKQIVSKLPFQFAGGQLKVNGRDYDARRAGLIMVYPNSAVAGRCVLLFTAENADVLSRLSQEFCAKAALVGDKDALVGSPTDDAKSWQWKCAERFDWAWRWPSSPGKAIAVVSSAHPDWQWRQLIAQSLMEETKADVAILPNMLLSSMSEFTGELTEDAVNRFLRNNWVVELVFPKEGLLDVIKRTIDSGNPELTLRINKELLDELSGLNKIGGVAAVKESGFVRIIIANHARFDYLPQLQMAAEPIMAEWCRYLLDRSSEVRLSNVFAAECLCRALAARQQRELDAALTGQPDHASIQKLRAILDLQEITSP